MTIFGYSLNPLPHMKYHVQPLLSFGVKFEMFNENYIQVAPYNVSSLP